MRVPTCPGPISSYVADLGKSLPGPRRVRGELLAELADGLRDAAEAYGRSGASPDQAEARAVEEVGALAEVARGYRCELVASQGRRTAVLLAVSMPALVMAWTLAWTYGMPATLTAPASDRAIVGTLAQLTDWAGLAGGVGALLAAGMLTWSGRVGLPARPVVAALAGLGAGSLLIAHGCSLAMSALYPEPLLRLAETSVVLVPLLIATFGLGGWQFTSLWRSYRIVSGRDPNASVTARL